MKARIEFLIHHLADGKKSEFAKIIGKSNSTVSALLNGEQFFSHKSLILLAEIGVNLHWLIVGMGTPSASKDDKIFNPQSVGIRAVIAYLRSEQVRLEHELDE